MNISVTIANDLRILSITSVNTGYKTLRELVNVALAAKSAPANELPSGNVIQIGITPSANLLVRDSISGDDVTLATGVKMVFPLINALDRISVKNTATVAVEIYFGAP